MSGTIEQQLSDATSSSDGGSSTGSAPAVGSSKLIEHVLDAHKYKNAEAAAVDSNTTSAAPRQSRGGLRNEIVWLLMGLLNNVPWVISTTSAGLLGGASYGATFFASSVSCLLVCLVAPYTFHYVSYDFRVLIAALLNLAGFVMLGAPYYTLSAPDQADAAMWSQLVGYFCIGVGVQAGECTLLPYCSSYGKRCKIGRRYLTYYSSGTGFAGIIGASFGLIMMYADVPPAITALSAMVFPATYLALFFCVLDRRSYPGGGGGTDDDHDAESELEAEDAAARAEAAEAGRKPVTAVTADEVLSREKAARKGKIGMINQEYSRDHGSDLTLSQRVRFVLSLFKYIVPLFLVYFAEYLIMSGIWPALALGNVSGPGSKDNRTHFYKWAYLSYQVAVTVSRSSGILIEANYLWIVLVPMLQCGMVGLFAAVAATQAWVGWTLLIPAFVTGLFGGFAYVQTYTYMSDNMPENRKELAIAATTIGENLGSSVASLVGLGVQAALWSRLGIE